MKETEKIPKLLCCTNDKLDGVIEALGGSSDTSYVADSYLENINTGDDADVTFDDPVSCVEVLISGADSTTVVTITTTPALTAGNGQVMMFANDYKTFCFDNVKVTSINILNNSSGTVTYIINGLHG